MSESAAADLQDFFEQIWGDTEGYVYLPVKEGDRVRKFFLRWPEKAPAVVRHILKYAAIDGCEVFFSPALYSEMKATNKSVLGSWVAWTDFDGNFPETWPESIAPRPHVEVQSSTRAKRHAYWRLDEFTSAKDIEKINRSLAYALGADTSGWDANQFLRPPYSVNRKYSKPIVAKIVADRIEYADLPVEAFSGLPTPTEAIRNEISMSDVPSIDEVKTLAKWDDDLLELFSVTADEAKTQTFDRSGGLARLAYKGAELGWTDEQIFAALLDTDDRWGKYRGRPTRQKILTELINRARAKIGYDPVSDKALLSSLLKDKEVEDADEQEFFSISELNELPGIDNWAIKGLLPERGMGLFTGRPGTGKTQLALQLAAYVATGRPDFLGFELPGGPKKVLFLSLEMSAHQLQHFTINMSKIYDIKLLDENLVIYGKGEPVPMNKEEGQHLVDQWFDQYRPDLVIVDSLSQATTDLSSDDEMKAFFDFIRRLKVYHNFAIVFVHHHRKKANDAASRKQANSQSDIYGSFQIAATADFAFDLEDRGDNGLLDGQFLKTRYLAPQEEPMKLIRDERLHFTVFDGLGGRFDDDGVTDPTGKGLNF